MQHAAGTPERVEFCLADGNPSLSVRWSTFAELSTDIAQALGTAWQGCSAAKLPAHEHERSTIAGVIAWMETWYEASTVKESLEAVQEAREKAFRPLASLTATEIAYLFSYHALNKRLLLLTCNTESLKKEDMDRVDASALKAAEESKKRQSSQPAGAPPLVTRESAGDPRGAAAAAASAIEEVEPVTGATLGEDAAGESFDKDRFKRMYRLYKPNMLLRLARTWHSCGVHELEIVDERVRDARALYETKLMARAKAADAATAQAATAVVERKGACFATLRLAHHLGLNKLVRVAVERIAEEWLDVQSAAALLLHADELNCSVLRNRVSGFIVSHMTAVSATPVWRECVPSWQHVRLFELAAAARYNLHGLMGSSSQQLMGREAASDVFELVIYARETLFNVEERLVEAKAAVDGDIGAASEEHARAMIEEQEERIRALRGFIAEHEHLPQRIRRAFHADRLVWACHNMGGCASERAAVAKVAAA